MLMTEEEEPEYPPAAVIVAIPDVEAEPDKDCTGNGQSESLVRWVAYQEGIAAESLGVKGKSGILKSMESRAAFLHDSTHKVVCYYTPNHASWMNQVEIWLSILVRKLLKRGNFLSLDDLRGQILAFIAYYNRTMAKPIKWTYTGLA